MNTKKRSQKARNKWQKAITLLKNPMILAEYQQKHKRQSPHVVQEVGGTFEIQNIQGKIVI